MKTNERRANTRKRVIFGAQASDEGKTAKRDCVIRNFSEAGAFIELKDVHTLADDIALTVARKGVDYAARVVWSRENAAGVAFKSVSPSIVPDNELERRLRASERKMRKLRQRVKQLTGEG